MPPPSSISKLQSMSNVKNRKRLNPYETTKDSPPAKRIKSSSAFGLRLAPYSKKTGETARDLLLQSQQRAYHQQLSLDSQDAVDQIFAIFEGLCPEPTIAAQMSSNWTSSAPSSRRTQSTKATTVSSKAKRSSAYDKNFEQNLIDHGIYPEGFEHTDGRSTPEPDNLDDIVRELAYPRASLSPSQFSVLAFKNFKLANSRVISEGKVMADIFPIIRGNSTIPNEGNLPFVNLDSITDGTTVDAVPDLYDGSHLKELYTTVRQDLSNTVIPTSHGRAPIAPNFFMEAKAPRGGADVAKRQACLDGAVGARAMHSLQNYGENKTVYDGDSRTFSSTYHAGTGTLQLYAHHATAPAAEDERPEYHMTQIDTWGMTGNINTFRRGATAFRNARELARRQRYAFIQEANARSSTAQQVATGVHIRDGIEDNRSHSHVDHSETTAWQDCHDDLQQHITETCAEDFETNGEVTAPFQQYCASDESQEPSQGLEVSGADGLSMSFVSNFTSNVSTVTTRAKRSRQSSSSPTQGSRSSKSRARPTALERPANSPTAAVGLGLSGPSELY